MEATVTPAVKGVETGKPNGAAGLEPITVTVKQAMAVSGLGQSSVWTLIRDRKVDSVMVAGRRLIILESLRKLLTEGES